MSKQDRQGVRTAKDIEQKYKLGSYDRQIGETKTIAQLASRNASSAMQTATNAMQLAETANSTAENAAENANKAIEGMEDHDLRIADVEEKSEKNEADIALLKSASGNEDITTFDDIYPIGSIYLTINDTDPGTLFQGTTWEKLEGVIPCFVNGEFEVSVSGEDIIVDTGGDGTDVPSYIQINAWRRVENPEEPEVPEEEGDVIGSED